MIITSLPGDQLEIITQIDHARFAADLLSLWICDGLPEHARREDLIFAVREHDNGWREKDSAPVLDSVRGDRPYDFIGMPAEIRVDLWKLGCQRFRSERAYASLLIVEHALHLHAHRPEAVYKELMTWLAEQRSELLQEGASREDLLAKDYGFLELVDLISLVACSDLFETLEIRGTAVSMDDKLLKLDPFPLAGTTTFRIPQRTIPRRNYLDAAELAGEMATARWHWREIRVGS